MQAKCKKITFLHLKLKNVLTGEVKALIIKTEVKKLNLLEVKIIENKTVQREM